jgi:hypothetical protein
LFPNVLVLEKVVNRNPSCIVTNETKVDSVHDLACMMSEDTIQSIANILLIRIKFFSLSEFVEGSLEVNHPTLWTDEKQSRAEAERRGRLAERRSEEKE